MRFRNHITIIVERMGSAFLALFLALISILNQNKALLTGDVVDFIAEPKVLMALGGIVALIVLIILWQVIVWSKTFISIQDNTIVIERNTLNQKKNVIGIKNISNINTEQNIFERIVGTCKVKLDTNSLSTADKTDVKIILKKGDAENFRLEVMRLMRNAEMVAGETTGFGNQAENSRSDETYDIQSNLGDIMSHGLFSISLISLLVIIGCIVGMVQALSDAFQLGFVASNFMSVLVSLFLVLFIFFSALWDIAKGFIQYYNFKVKRRGNKIYLKYGLLKRVNYTIPVDKIHAVKLTQSVIARITGRYMAEIINVGMGNDGGGVRSFLVLYCKKDKLVETIQKLLPEFGDIFEEPAKRQPRTVWLAWIFSMTTYALSMAVCMAITLEFLPQFSGRVMTGVVALTILVALLVICRYFTAGSVMGEKHLILVNGYFGRRMTCIAYKKIQYIRIEQNILAKLAKIQKGSIFLLASSANKAQGIPYFPEDQAEKLKANILTE